MSGSSALAKEATSGSRLPAPGPFAALLTPPPVAGGCLTRRHGANRRFRRNRRRTSDSTHGIPFTALASPSPAECPLTLGMTGSDSAELDVQQRLRFRETRSDFSEKLATIVPGRSSHSRDDGQWCVQWCIVSGRGPSGNRRGCLVRSLSVDPCRQFHASESKLDFPGMQGTLQCNEIRGSRHGGA